MTRHAPGSPGARRGSKLAFVGADPGLETPHEERQDRSEHHREQRELRHPPELSAGQRHQDDRRDGRAKRRGEVLDGRLHAHEAGALSGSGNASGEGGERDHAKARRQHERDEDHEYRDQGGFGQEARGQGGGEHDRSGCRHGGRAKAIGEPAGGPHSEEAEHAANEIQHAKVLSGVAQIELQIRRQRRHDRKHAHGGGRHRGEREQGRRTPEKHYERAGPHRRTGQKMTTQWRQDESRQHQNDEAESRHAEERHAPTETRGFETGWHAEDAGDRERAHHDSHGTTSSFGGNHVGDDCEGQR